MRRQFILFLIVLSVLLTETAYGLPFDAEFGSAVIPKTQGCPLASIWTTGSSYPFDTVKGPLSGASGVAFSAPSSCTRDEFDAIALQIQQDYVDGIVDGPGSSRALFHSAGTFSAVGGPDGLGGVNGGWLKFPENAAFPTSAGLGNVITYIQNLVEKYPCITFADAITLNGAIVTEATGGPAVAWMPGRRDAQKTPKNPVITSRLPDGSYTIAAVVSFYTQMGLTDREMAVLSGGGHSLGGCRSENSGWNGSFTEARNHFPSPKNLFLIQTFEESWVPQVVRNGTEVRIQYILLDSDGTPVTDALGNNIIRIPCDTSILLGGNLPTAWAYSYSKDEDLFLDDYARVLQRISQLGAGVGGWSLNQSQYVWLGINGTANNHGVDIEPQGGDPPVSVADFQPPKWIQNLAQGQSTLMSSTGVQSAPSSEAVLLTPFMIIFALALIIISG